MKAVVTVMLKAGVLDPQGKAIGQALAGLGFAALFSALIASNWKHSSPLDRAQFDLVAKGRGGAVGVDVVDVRGLDARVADGAAHRAEAAVAIIGGGGNVVGVAGQAVANNLGVDLRAAGLGVLVFLKHQHPGAFTHDKAVAGHVVGTGGLLRGVVEVRRHGAAGDEAGDAQGADRGLRAARDHDVGGAGGDDGMIGPLEPIADRDLAGGEFDQGGGNEEGRDPPRPFFVQLDGGRANGVEAADTGSDDNPGPFAIMIVFGRPARVPYGFVGGGHGVEDEIVDPALVL